MSAVAPFKTLTNDFEPGCLSFSPDGKILAVAGRQVDRVKPSRVSNRLAFWDIEAQKKLGILRAAGAADSEASAAGAVAFANDGRTVAVAYKDGWMRLWDLTWERLVSEFHEHTNDSWYGVNVFFSRDSHWLGLSSISEIVLYDVRDLPKMRRYASWDCRHWGGMSAATFAPGGRTLVTSGNDGRIKFWNLATREVALTLIQGHGPYATLNFSADGNKLCSSDGNGIVKLWLAASVNSIPSDL
jgi:WD40 repeat protein